MNPLVQRISHFVAQNSPAILTGLGVSGVFATAVLTAKGAVKSDRQIRDFRERVFRDNKEADPGDELIPDPTWKDELKLTWMNYLPGLSVGLGTAFCVISAQSINSRRTAALMTLYSMSEKTVTEIREKVREIHGEKRLNELDEEMTKDHLRDNPPSQDIIRRADVIGSPGSLCLDRFSGRYFVSDTESLRKAMNDVNSTCINQMYASLNDYWGLVGLSPLDVGETVGWTSDNLLELEFVYVPAEDGRPCMAVSFKRQPKMDYYRIF